MIEFLLILLAVLFLGVQVRDYFKFRALIRALDRISQRGEVNTQDA